MNLLNQQKLLADLYTNKKIREEYFNGMSDGKPDQKEVTIFAEGLVLKRLNAVKSWLPLSFSYNGKLLYQLFLQYAPVNPMKGLHLKHQLDCLAFYDFVKKKSSMVDPYLLEILRYELFNLKMTLPGNKLLFQTFNFLFDKATTESIGDKILLKGNNIRFVMRMTSTGKWIRLFK
jgi:hypothetical protein